MKEERHIFHGSLMNAGTDVVIVVIASVDEVDGLGVAVVAALVVVWVLASAIVVGGFGVDGDPVVASLPAKTNVVSIFL